MGFMVVRKWRSGWPARAMLIMFACGLLPLALLQRAEAGWGRPQIHNPTAQVIQCIYCGLVSATMSSWGNDMSLLAAVATKQDPWLKSFRNHYRQSSAIWVVDRL